MNTANEPSPPAAADPVEHLLKQAARRPSPPREDEAAVRDAVYGEWRARVRQRRRGRSVLALAAAASVVLAVLVMANRPDPVPVPGERVASVVEQIGTVYRVGEQAALLEVSRLEALRTGDVFQTGSAAGLSLDWGAGLSVRLAGNARIEIVAPDRLYLQRGRLYVDTHGLAGADSFTVVTDQGDITHLGTQYQVGEFGDELTVAVREGEVRIHGNREDTVLRAGRRYTVRGDGRAQVADQPRHGEFWAWTEPLAGSVDMDGQTLATFLDWVARETGYELEYADAATMRTAETTVLVGAVDAEPRTELELRLMTADLGYLFDPGSGSLRVSMNGRDGEN